MASVESRPKRPLGVTIIAIVAVWGGLLSLSGGASVLAGTANWPVVLAILDIIFGVLGLALGVAFYAGAKWAWMAGITIYVIAIGLGAAGILYGGSIGSAGGVIRILAGIIILVYLTRPKTKSFFGRTASSIAALEQSSVPE